MRRAASERASGHNPGRVQVFGAGSSNHVNRTGRDGAPDPINGNRPRVKTDWESVYRSTYAEVVGFLSRMLLDHERAKELAQEAFAHVLGQEAVNPRGLVFRTAANLARDEARMVVRRKRHLKLLKVEEDVRAERAPTPAQELDTRERSRRVQSALEALSETDRTVLVLWNAGFDYDEIAGRTGLSKGAIGTTVARAKKKFVSACDAMEDTDAAHG
jgi:RNA polymerase sigma factor (sigma-70 family)